jgi:hypothetical protein
MPTAKLTVTLPESTWISEVTRDHPDATFRVLAAMPREDAGVGLVEITAEAARMPAILDAFESYDEVRHAEPVHATDDEAIVQFETTEPLLLVSVQNSMLPLEFPVTLVDGRASMELTTSRDRMSAFAEQLDAFGMTYDVEYVYQSRESETLLTDRQRRLVEAAVREGYYGTPRECTLTQLADREGIAKSTASECLHRAESKIVRRFVRDVLGGGTE